MSTERNREEARWGKVGEERGTQLSLLASVSVILHLLLSGKHAKNGPRKIPPKVPMSLVVRMLSKTPNMQMDFRSSLITSSPQMCLLWSVSKVSGVPRGYAPVCGEDKRSHAGEIAECILSILLPNGKMTALSRLDITERKEFEEIGVPTSILLVGSPQGDLSVFHEAISKVVSFKE